ncbi:helix-turn-helix domain-containing protein [Streptomyces sp. NPDC092369]|uniref:TetR/AcrR family transcriptional regulator n=1 Tax=Streptomyces sp. NPDC092369 TaxID=3366015 RepID=UPI00382DB494
MASTSGGARLRSDAVRNRARITQAARSLIVTRGLAVEMDEIAREAGVAVGTVYRHFPAKSNLMEAVLAELGAEIEGTHAEAVSRVEAGRSAGYAELAALFRRAVVDANEERLLRELGPAGGPCLPPEVQLQAESAMNYLIAAAHRDGDLRADVTMSDVELLLTHAPTAQTSRKERERWVTLALRSLASPERVAEDLVADRSRGQ